MKSTSGENSTKLRLRIPAPARGEHPPDRVRYISRAGEMQKPALDEKVERIALMRKQLVRVLDDDGHAVGEWVPQMSVEDKVRGLRDMMLTRAFDARLLRAHRQGKTSFYMQCLGEEAIACAQQRALRPGDMHFPTYRQQGLLISAGYPLVDMMNQVMSNEFDPLHGRQLPVMYSAKSHGFFSISGNLATQYIALQFANFRQIKLVDEFAVNSSLEIIKLFGLAGLDRLHCLRECFHREIHIR